MRSVKVGGSGCSSGGVTTTVAGTGAEGAIRGGIATACGKATTGFGDGGAFFCVMAGFGGSGFAAIGCTTCGAGAAGGGASGAFAHPTTRNESSAIRATHDIGAG